MNSLKDKTAIVIGAGSGIGRSTAISLGTVGARVIAADRDRESADSCVAEIESQGGRALAAECEAACDESVRELVHFTLRNFGPIHSLVCNAGIMLLKSASDASAEDWAKSFEINVTAAALAARHVGQEMKLSGGGAIVLVASISGHKPERGFATYSASKAALLMLTRSLALDYGGSNIRINAVSPGPVETPGLQHLIEGAGADWGLWKQRVVEMQCLRTMTQPRDVASAIVFLCSDEARMITGTSLIVDGGLVARSPHVF
jgi:NAD(P)-dependent dehydrogenase (short-subunit alcohol dehydrogenase family)